MLSDTQVSGCAKGQQFRTVSTASIRSTPGWLPFYTLAIKIPLYFLTPRESAEWIANRRRRNRCTKGTKRLAPSISLRANPNPKRKVTHKYIVTETKGAVNTPATASPRLVKAQLCTQSEGKEQCGRLAPERRGDAHELRNALELPSIDRDGLVRRRERWLRSASRRKGSAQNRVGEQRLRNGTAYRSAPWQRRANKCSGMA